MTFWKWIVRHWYIPLTVAGALLGMFAGTQFQKRGSVKDVKKRVTRELKAIDAATEMAEIVEKSGHTRALDVLDAKHKVELEALDEKTQARAAELRDNPAALSKFLVRIVSEG